VTQVALRGLLGRKLRTVLTAIAIVLGISMVSGTYVLTDTINASFDQIFQQANRKLDVVITGKTVVSSDRGARAAPGLPASLLSVVKQTPGVAAAEGEIGGEAQLFDLKGNALGASGGAPSLLVSVPSSRFRSSTLVQGHWPHGAQLAVDLDTFNRRHLRLGEKALLAGQIPAQQVTIVAAIKFGSGGSLGGASLLEVDLKTGQRLTQKQGKFDQISIAADAGVSQRALAQRLKDRIPPNLRGLVSVKTAAQNAADETSAIGKALNFITIALLAFAGIAIFVGAFIIFNTFSITVAQRTREFALLRTIGAMRRQVLVSVILEALVIGLLSSLIGLVAGFGIAQGLNAVFKKFGADLPNSGMVIETRTIVVSLLVGTLVTLVAGFWPAVRATRVPPLAALREGSQLPKGRLSRARPYISVAVAVIGLLAMSRGVFGNISGVGSRLSLIGLGAVLLFLGVAMVSPQLVRPLANVIGWPMERFTAITGRLARENTVRNPSRTAITAAALMIGLALVGFVTIFAAELRVTANDAINRELAGDFVVQNQQGLLPAGAAAAVARVPGVAVVSPVESDALRLRGGRKGKSATISGVVPSTFAKVYRLQWKQGSAALLTNLGPKDVLVGDTYATDQHLRVGSHVSLTTSVGKTESFTVTGIFKTSQILDPLVIRYDTMKRDWKLNSDVVDLVNVTPGQDLTTVQKRIERVLKAQFPVAQVLSQQDVKDQNSKQINQLLYLIYVLLAMSVLVSLFGIMNTLVLSIYERTREIGMLRAIGITRTQLRMTVAWESVITAVIGAVLGLLLGIVLAVLVTAGLQSEGVEYVIPIASLLFWVAFSIVFGVVAAVYPAIRAARLDVLQAIAYE
jgi:putative ABC transport system permease protein